MYGADLVLYINEINPSNHSFSRIAKLRNLNKNQNQTDASANFSIIIDTFFVKQNFKTGQFILTTRTIQKRFKLTEFHWSFPLAIWTSCAHICS